MPATGEFTNPAVLLSHLRKFFKMQITGTKLKQF